MKKEILVSEKSIEEAVDYINSLEEKEFHKLSDKLFRDQFIIKLVISGYATEGELNVDLVGEIIHLTMIVWQSFINECAEVPIVTEGVMDRVIDEDFDMDVDFGKSLGLDLNDAEVSEKMERLNKKFSKKEVLNPEDLLKLLEDEGFHNFMPALLENLANLPQQYLESFIASEVIDLDNDYEPSDLANAQSVLRIIIKAFDTVVNQKPLMHIVKSQKTKTDLKISAPVRGSAYQIKISLDGIKPPIWRRVLVEDDISLDYLNIIIQDVMGWEGYHAYSFRIGNLVYSVVDEDDFGLMDYIDSEETLLRDVVKKEKQKFKYTYDFGDNWKHTILIEKILTYDKDQDYPVCLKGKRNCPPEDCGGIWGYQDFVEAISDKNHHEHEELLEWAGGEFDPEEFDIDEINTYL